MDELTQIIMKENWGIILQDAHRLKKKNRESGVWKDIRTVCIVVKGKVLPEKLSLWNMFCPVYVYIPATRICFKCGGLGHTGKFCTKEKLYLKSIHLFFDLLTKFILLNLVKSNLIWFLLKNCTAKCFTFSLVYSSNLVTLIWFLKENLFSLYW